ncbi:MAG: Multiple antibiotic resistance protein MarR [candidate division BRC1 bacterium ADurb.BinA364]|nr:MAG: Multiple antibiotic resistance protein MarR [candidate division BRC1 bacterium ADurb.BinA364]
MTKPSPNATQHSRESAGRWLAMIHRCAHGFMRGRLGGHGLGPGQFRFLTSLYARDGMTQEELAAAAEMDKGAASRSLRKLESEGFIERTPDEADRRHNRVRLTAKGRAIEPLIWKARKEWSDALFQGFSGEDRREALRLLERMAGNALAASSAARAERDGEAPLAPSKGE